MIEYDLASGVCFRTLDFLGFPGYRVGDDGSVWSCRKQGGGHRDTWKLLVPDVGAKQGHLRVLLMPGRVHWPVHHLVLEAFVGPCPPGLICRHFPDRDPTNNRVTNVRWGTHKENTADRRVHGTQRVQRGEYNVMAKLTTELVLEIRANHARGVRQTELAAKHGVSRATICLVVNRKVWGHV